jgi:SAM-dependent methyltransferase
MARATYFPEVFDAPDVRHARGIILTPEAATTDFRWETETPFIGDLAARWLAPAPETLVVDYGCGIGRMAKELIDRHQCSVIGVDISADMRRMAGEYVGSDRFLACSPQTFDLMVARGLRCDAAISVWVLQHCLKPAEDIARIGRALRPGAGVFIVNNVNRAVPTRELGWANDGIDIKALLAQHFEPLASEAMPREIVTESLAGITWWAALRMRTA